MKKIISLILAAALLTSTVACSSDGGSSSEATSSATTSQTDATASTTAATPSDDEKWGRPNWIVGDNANPNRTSDVVFTREGDDIYAYDYTSTTPTSTKLTTDTDEYDYTDLNVYGEELYAIRTIKNGTPAMEFVSLYVPEGQTATFAKFTIPRVDISAPALIEDALYYSDDSDGTMYKLDLKTQEEEQIYTDSNLPISTFLYDSSYIYFQSLAVDDSTGGDLSKDSGKKIYRFALSDPSQVESMEVGSDYFLQSVYDGNILLTTGGSADTDAKITFMKSTWGGEVAEYLATPKDDRTVLAIQPYYDGYAVLSGDTDKTYLSYYDQEGNFNKELGQGISKESGDNYQTFSVASFGDSLLYSIDQSPKEGDGTDVVKTIYYITPIGEAIEVPSITNATTTSSTSSAESTESGDASSTSEESEASTAE